MKKRLLGFLLVFLLPAVAAARPATHFSGESRPIVKPSMPEVPIVAPDLAEPAQGGGTLTTYFYVVTAVDVNGLESANSNEASATLKQGMKVGVTLTWVAPVVGTGQAAVAGYNMKRGTTTGGPYTKLNSSLITGLTYVDPFVAPAAPGSLGATVN